MKEKIKNWLKNNLKQIFSVALLILIVSGSILIYHDSYADVWVNGYYRSNGTYVSGHYRSSPDGNPYNNWSFPGNTNPYTGETAVGNPETYLQNYYGTSNSYSPSYSIPSYSSFPYYSPSTPSCPISSTYDSLSGSCKCNYGYVVSGDKCVYGNSYCYGKYGYNSSYDSLSKSCKCDYGYRLDSSNQCVSQDSYCQGTYGYNTEYSLLDSACKCKRGYVLNDTKTRCISGDSYCQNKYGYYANYDSLIKTCKCDSGYTFKNGKCAKETLSFFDSIESPQAFALSSAIDYKSKTNTSEESNIPEGALIRTYNGIDVYIVKYVHLVSGTKKFKRLILSPSVFNNYGHLKWEDIIDIEQSVIDSFTTSELVRAVGDGKIYKLYPQGDTGEKRLIKDYSILVRLGYDADSVYEINQFDRNSYITGFSIE